MLLAIDPGSHGSGAALFDGGVLSIAGVFTENDIPRQLWREFGPWGTQLDTIVIEKPEEQKFRRTRPRIDDIVTLSLVAGEIAGRFAHTSTIQYLKPSQWKRHVPKPKSTKLDYIIEARCLQFLSSDEADRIDLPASVTRQWDVWDAIGLGLVALGRARRGVV